MSKNSVVCMRLSKVAEGIWCKNSSGFSSELKDFPLAKLAPPLCTMIKSALVCAAKSLMVLEFSSFKSEKRRVSSSVLSFCSYCLKSKVLIFELTSKYTLTPNTAKSAKKSSPKAYLVFNIAYSPRHECFVYELLGQEI